MDDIYCFGGNPLDRASEHRDDREWIAALLGDPETRILPLRDLKPSLAARRRRHSIGNRWSSGATRSTPARR